MKIGDLDERCGNCSLIDFCTEPFETPQLCCIDELAEMETSEYKSLVESITKEEISVKLQEYEENNISPWTDNRAGAMVDIVLERLMK